MPTKIRLGLFPPASKHNYALNIFFLQIFVCPTPLLRSLQIYRPVCTPCSIKRLENILNVCCSHRQSVHSEASQYFGIITPLIKGQLLVVLLDQAMLWSTSQTQSSYSGVWLTCQCSCIKSQHRSTTFLAETRTHWCMSSPVGGVQDLVS